MPALIYRLTLQAPAIIRDGRDVSYGGQTLAWIPGAQIRGALARAYLAGRGSIADAAGDEEFRALFLSPDVRYLHAYLEGSQNDRLLPSPLSWQIPKGGTEDMIYDRLHGDWPARVRENRGQQWVEAGLGFVVTRAETVEFRRPTLVSRQHLALGRREGAVAENSSIFIYQAIGAGERLQGVVLAEQPEELARVRGLLEGAVLRVGRSAAAGYGGAARVEVIGELEPWQEAPRPTQVTVGRCVRLTCLSEYVAPHAEALDPLQGLEHELGARVIRSDIRTTVVGGYNRTWHLPLSQDLALTPGSSVVLQFQEALSEERRETIEWRGLGRRRNEGFGRVAFAWPNDRQEFATRWLEAPYINTPADTLSPVVLAPGHRQTLHTMARRIVQQGVDQELAKRAALACLDPSVSPSLLQRLRQILVSVPDFAAATEFVQGLAPTRAGEKPKPAYASLTTAHLTIGDDAHRSFYDWLVQFVTHPGPGSDWQVWVLSKAREQWREQPLARTLEGVEFDAVFSESEAWKTAQRFLDRLLSQLAHGQGAL